MYAAKSSVVHTHTPTSNLLLHVGAQELAITRLQEPTLLADLSRLVNNAETFPDITFMVEGQPIVAHKAILVTRCEHFRAMFSTGMRESRSDTVTYPPETAITRAAFLAMLEWLYCGRVPGLHRNAPRALEVLALAQYMGIEGLKSLAEAALVHAADVSNVCSLYLAARKYGSTSLEHFCLEYVLKHHAAVSLDELTCEPLLLLEITRELLRRQAHK